MTSKNRQTTDEIARRREVLETARRTLKEEFIGVGETIDAVIRDISPWFLFPELLSRPTVINLWGMTGVGKTSLVNRLVDLIGFQREYFWFDLGDKNSSISFQDSYTRLAARAEDLPMIVAFDEVHHGRCLDEFGREISEDRNRPMWELLDSGTVNNITWFHFGPDFGETAKTVEGLLAKGARVVRGEFVTGLKQAEHELDRNFKREKSRLFIAPDTLENVVRIVGQELGISLKTDLEKLLRTMDGKDAVRFLRMVDASRIQSTKKRFSRLLIFVMGNLDEAFPMCHDFSADRDADLFYRRSLEVSIPLVKDALKKRFRSEQIARLGNTHIIFPAVRKQSFEKLISRELGKISHHVSDRFGIGLTFDESVHQLVYAEGVYPTQGFRPLFSTVHQLLKGNIGTFLSEAFASRVPIVRMALSVEARRLIAVFDGAKGTVFTSGIDLPTPLSDLRKCRLDDRQAITAVHESGHAIAQMVLAQVIPIAIHSVTSDHDNNGFMSREGKLPPVTPQVLLNEAAIMLGGYAAEKMVFGKSGVTNGSESDMERATGMVCQALKRCGMGSRQMLIESWKHEDEYALHETAIEQEIADVLKEALVLAEASLKSEWRLLLELADYLSDHSTIEEAGIRAMCRDYSCTGLPDTITAEPRETGHRRKLKQLIADLVTEDAPLPDWPDSLERSLSATPPADLPLAAEG